MHIALHINLRYRPKQLPMVITINFTSFAQIDRGIIPLHKNLLRSFQNDILTQLWLDEISGHDTEPLRLDKHGSCTQKRLQPLLSSILCTNDLQKRFSVFLFFSIETLVAALVRAFWQPASSLTQWAGPRIYHKWRVYGLPHATYIAMFITIFCKTLVRATQVYFCSISMTTQARDFLKFAGAIVQRLQYMYMQVMATLTHKNFSAHYAWFSRGRSHIYYDW